MTHSAASILPMPIGRHLWLPVLTFSLLLALTASIEGNQTRTPPDVTLVFSRHYYSGQRLCRLTVRTLADKGWVTLRCGTDFDGATEATTYKLLPFRERMLTRTEAGLIRDMTAAAHLYDGDYVGADLRANDLFLELLQVSEGARTAVLVTSVNPSFANGHRRKLIEWLRAEEAALRKPQGSEQAR